MSIKTSDGELEQRVLEHLFDAKPYHYNLRRGSVVSGSDDRIVYLSVDLVRGIYRALERETGDAWGVILKSCGFVWGKRVARALHKELREVARLELDELPVTDFVVLLERYFAHHGWGRLHIDLGEAETCGVVQARLHNSLFLEALDDVQGPVDHLIAGMLRSMFEMISGRHLDCLEVGCAGANPYKASAFLISTPARLQQVEPMIEQGAQIDQALARLRAA